MKVLGIKHKVTSENNASEYLAKLQDSLTRTKDVDLVVGPDYALSYLNSEGKIDFSNQGKVISDLERLSESYPETVFLPGTMPIELMGKMANAAHVIYGGDITKIFKKETDTCESQIAEKNGLKYFRGNNKYNNFEMEDETIAVAICSDHGKQVIPGETFLEVVLAYDDFGAVFSPMRPYTNSFVDRFGLVVEGRKGEVLGVRYESKKTLEEITPEVETDEFALFDFK